MGKEIYQYTVCPTKVAQQRNKKSTSPRNIRVKKNTLTFMGPAFFVDHTWTDRSGLMGAAGRQHWHPIGLSCPMGVWKGTT